MGNLLKGKDKCKSSFVVELAKSDLVRPNLNRIAGGLKFYISPKKICSLRHTVVKSMDHHIGVHGLSMFKMRL